MWLVMSKHGLSCTPEVFCHAVVYVIGLSTGPSVKLGELDTVNLEMLRIAKSVVSFRCSLPISMVDCSTLGLDSVRSPM